MPEPNQNAPATVPEQPEVKPPLRKSTPVVIALVVIIGLIGIANLSSLLSGNRKSAPASAISMRPAAPNAHQVNSFESQQQLPELRGKRVTLTPHWYKTSGKPPVDGIKWEYSHEIFPW